MFFGRPTGGAAAGGGGGGLTAAAIDAAPAAASVNLADHIPASQAGTLAYETPQQLFNAISLLASAGALAGANLLPVTQAGVAKSISLTLLQAAFNPTGALALGFLANPLAAGSLGTASLQLAAAGDGLWQPAAHIVGVQANSLEVARFESSGATTSYLRIVAQASGTQNVLLVPGGSGLNIGMRLMSKGTSAGKILQVDDGVQGWHFLGSGSGGHFESDDQGTGGPSIRDATSSATVPLYAFLGDTATGFGRAAAAVPCITAAGASVAQFSCPIATRNPVQFDATTTALATVPGLSVSVLANRTYSFEASLFVTPDAVGGAKYAIAGTATATAIIYEITHVSDTGNSITIASRQTALGGSAGAGGAGTGLCRIKGLITVNAAGTLSVQFAQNAANGTSSVLVGSDFQLRDNP